MTPTEMIIAAINEANLTVDDCLAIQNAARNKRQLTAASQTAVIKYRYGVGTRVETYALHNAENNGMQGTIREVRTKRCVVAFDSPIRLGRGRNTRYVREVTIPMDCLKVIAPPPRIIAKQEAAPLMVYVGGSE